MDGALGTLCPRLIPAHAGKTVVPPFLLATNKAHPRSRGENLNVCAIMTTFRGSSPLTRGKLSKVLQMSATHGLIPAHAGKTV